MNKKTAISLLLTLTTTTQAFAWDLVFAKGDDPQIIKDISEAAKHGATQLSNAARDAIAAVGNATGISNIIDSNKQTLSNIGTIYACVATLCYSEVIKKKQLEEAEQDAKTKLDSEIAATTNYYNKLNRTKRISQLRTILDDSANMLNNLKNQLSLVNAEKTNNAATIKSLNTQIIWNESMAKQKLNERPALTKTDMSATARKFEQKFNYDYYTAVNDLNNDLMILEKSTNRSRGELMSDLIYALNDSTLRNFVAELEKEKMRINDEIMQLEADISDYKAKQESASAQYAQETQGL